METTAAIWNMDPKVQKEENTYNLYILILT